MLTRTKWSAVLFIYFIPKIHPFNFDLENPIVIHDTFDKVDSQFGASVIVAVSENGGFGWIVIGAPKADSPLANYSEVKEPGIVWRCSLGEESENQCSILEIDPIGEMDVKMGSVPTHLIHRDRKDYGMLGASMAVGSNVSVICSSRWCNKKYNNAYFMNGLCYWIPKSSLLSHNSTFPNFSHRLLPLVNISRQASAMASGNRFDWAFGQAGFSVDISDKNEILLGAPGILEWAGSVVQYRDYDPIKLNATNRRFNRNDSTAFARVLIPRAQTQIDRNILSYFDYFGYAVTSGHFFKLKNNYTQYAAGAPRGESLGGKVLVFSFREDSFQIGGNFDSSLNFLVEPIMGDTASFFGSYFGSVLAGVDVNGDALDELLVGAPFYETAASSLDSGNNSSADAKNYFSSGDEGCVFLYFSTGEDFDRNPQEICGDNRPGARFGSAITRLGDINHDGFQDVAIGAPYENEGRGAVYIYIGSPKRLILSQKISPEKLDASIRGFGCSMFGDVDIDQNSYADLAIGAYESNHVLVFRSFPVVDISGSLSSSVPALSSTTGVFSITSCLNFKGHNVPQELSITISLNIESNFWKTRTLEFISDSRFENFTKGGIQFKGVYKMSGTCYDFKLATVGDLDTTAAVPVTIRQEFWLDEVKYQNAKSEPMRFELEKDENGNPKLNGIPPHKEFSWKSQAKVQMSNLHLGNNQVLLSIPILAICEEDGDPSCMADLSLKAVFRTSDGITFDDKNNFVIGSSKSIVMQIEVANHRESANLPITMDISWSNPVSLRSSRSDCKMAESIQPEENNEKLCKCVLSAPLSRNKKEYIEVELDMTGLFAGNIKDTLEFNLRANTSSLLVKDPTFNVSLPLSHQSQLVLLGQQSDASYYENITTETLNFTQLFEVGLTGVSPIYGFQLQISIPATLHIDGEILSFLHIREPQITYDGERISCRAINDTFYEDSIFEKSQILERRKRQSTDKVPKKKGRIMEQPIMINCETSGVQCFSIECDGFHFTSSQRALIEFRLRLVTETARRLFTELDRDVLIIESTSTVRRLGTISESRFAVSRTIIRADLQAEIKAWILIVAAAGGLILLSLITLLLTRCGFFRRHKLEELAKLKAGAHDGDRYGFDNELQVADSLEYFDGPITETEFDYPFYVTNYRHRGSFADSSAIYDELELE